MKRYFLLPVIICSMFLFSLGQATYIVNTDTSEIVWIGKKIAGEHRGKVKISQGMFETDSNNYITSGSFEINMKTLSNEDPMDASMKAMLENHLKSEDFYDVDKFPTVSFKISKPVKIETGNIKIRGNLTIKDITQPIEFKALFIPSSDGYVAFSSFSVDRSSFNVKYGSASFFGDIAEKIIYDDFQILLRLKVKKTNTTVLK